MTFDGYYHLNCDDSICYESARNVWNAAIEAAQQKLEPLDFNEMSRYPHEVLEELKAK